MANWMGSVSSGLTFVLLQGHAGLHRHPCQRQTLLGPVTGIALSILVLDEHFTALQVVGIAGLLVIVYFLSSASIQPVQYDETNSSAELGRRFRRTKQAYAAGER